MNTLKRFALFAFLTTMLLSISACSDNVDADKVGGNIDQVPGAGKEKLAESSDAIRQREADITFNDLVLAAKVKNEIFKDPALKTSDINVDTHNGTVVLSGTVHKPEDAIRAVQIARSVDDVTSVDNKLSVLSNG
jgi:osmotically-inducible protein OsmY